MRTRTIGAILAAALTLGACGDEGPVGIESLVPEDLIQTFEVVLDASRFLTVDTTIGDFVDLDDLDYLLVAEDFGGALDAHSLMRFQVPVSFPVTGSSGSTVRDSAAVPFGGEIVVRIDSLRSVLAGPVRLALYRTGEAWDPSSATWDLRIDSGGVSEPWLVPGGTLAELVDSVTIVPGDTVATFQIDSATIASWADTTNMARGAVLVSETPGSRVQIDSLAFEVSARPSFGKDSVATESGDLAGRTLVMDPIPAPGGDRLFIGGAQAWRAYFRLQERLDTITVQVPGVTPAMTVTLGEATVNSAALILEPVEAPAGFVLSDTLQFIGVPVFGAGNIPLARAPVGSAFVGPIRVTADELAAPDATIEVDLSTVLRNLTVARPDDDSESAVAFALLGFQDRQNFGLAAFGGSGSAAAPRLRLILSVTQEARF